MRVNLRNLSAAVLCAACFFSSSNVAAGQRVEASGSLTPAGPPVAPPAKVDAGESCVVDLVQRYRIEGTLSGTLEISYRILVEGPCGSPPGTFGEEWIAHGGFAGTVEGTEAAGHLLYVARVQAGGDIEGRIDLGQGLRGELRVSGDFGDGSLTYRGWVE